MSILWVAGASAAPIYVGYAVDGSLIATVDAGSSGWYNSNGIITVGPGLYISTAITCTSPSPEPDLLSTSVDFSGSPEHNDQYDQHLCDRTEPGNSGVQRARKHLHERIGPEVFLSQGDTTRFKWWRARTLRRVQTWSIMDALRRMPLRWARSCRRRRSRPLATR